jgi:uncharacterized protein (DUF362 family)
MSSSFSRRNFWRLMAAGATAASAARGMQLPEKGSTDLVLPDTAAPFAGRSAVGLVKGDVRRTNVRQALEAIDDQLRPRLKEKKYVVIKVNNVSTNRQLAATHADALRGILDYLDGRFPGPVVIAEASAGNTHTGFENFQYNRVVDEYKKQHVSLVDLNEEGKYELLNILDRDMHLVPVRLAARLFDPEAFVLNAAVLKTHNFMVATMGVKNMALGAPLHQPPGATKRFNDKRKYHGSVRQGHIAIWQTARKMAPFWGASVVDGFEGMEGNGPAGGDAVDSRIAIASTDYIAADRVGVEAMGINPTWVGYLLYCWQTGIGQYDLNNIEIRGEAIANVRKKYELHKDIERELMWMGPMEVLPPTLG